MSKFCYKDATVALLPLSGGFLLLAPFLLSGASFPWPPLLPTLLLTPAGARFQRGRNLTPKKSVWKPVFLEGLRAHGNVTKAARDAGITRSNVYTERKRSETFAEEWDNARAEIGDRLEDVARQRAEGGSDTLLIFLLKGLKPDTYGERIKHQGDKDNPLEVNVGLKPETVDLLNAVAAKKAGGG
jgi:hypothetical protein